MKKNKIKKKNLFKKLQATSSVSQDSGFTLIELVVTLSIFILITTISLVKNSEFNSSIRLTNLVYQIALQVREAQSYGVSVKEFGVGSGDFNSGYGVYFSTGDLSSFIFFGDTGSKNKRYDASGGEFIDQLLIKGGNSISKFCATISGNEVCSDTGAINELDIVFERPKQDSLIVTNVASGYSSARVVVASPKGNVRSVKIESTGQISVQ